MKTMVVIGPPQKIMIKKRTSRTRSMTNGQELRADNNSAPRELLCLTWTMTWRSSLKTQASQLLAILRILTSFLILSPTTRTSKLLKLLIILLPKISFLTMLNSVYRLDRSLNRKLRTLLKRAKSNLKKMMTLKTLFLIVYVEPTLQNENVTLSTWSLISRITSVQIDESLLKGTNYQVNKSQLSSILSKKKSYLTNKQPIGLTLE